MAAAAAAAAAAASPARRVAFGSTQPRTGFPLRHGTDRLGSQMRRLEAPHIGPGCYDNHEYGTIVYDGQKTPQSKKGYILAARTAARFPASQQETPSPQQYQQDQTSSALPPPGKTPFNSTTQRFSGTRGAAQDLPGPGTYTPERAGSRKVSWPTRFGRPDWDKLPPLEKKSLRVKLASEKELMKQRSRVAYLSLYY